MFQLESHTVKIAGFNPRSEKHGDDNKLAADIKIQLCCTSGALDEFDKSLRAALYRKPAKGEQQDLIAGPDGLTAVKFPRIGAVRWDEEFPGYELTIEGGLGLTEPLVLVDVTLRKFSFEPLEGGSVAVTFSVICHPEPDEAGQLCALIQEDAEITLTPPTKQAVEEQREAA